MSSHRQRTQCHRERQEETEGLQRMRTHTAWRRGISVDYWHGGEDIGGRSAGG